MDIDRFWRMIDLARAAVGPAADQAVRDYNDPDDWDDDDPDDLEALDPADATGAADGDEEDGDEEDEVDDDDLFDFDDDFDEDEDELTDPVAIALFDQLVTLPAAEIAAFDNILDDVRCLADRPDLANAALLIHHGFLGRDSFDDFRAGLVALGRQAYEAALANPDSLATHPAVREIAAAHDLRWLAREDIIFAASHAYATVTGEDEITFLEFAGALRETDLPTPPEGDDWDIDDEAETRVRLPELWGLFGEQVRRVRHPGAALAAD